MIEDGVSGFLVATDDENGIAAAIRRLGDDAALGRRLTAAARQVCEERYCFRRRMEKEQAVYDEILGAPTGAASA
jgi:glycosyltransferase involved in cell wall biosynthesis